MAQVPQIPEMPSALQSIIDLLKKFDATPSSFDKEKNLLDDFSTADIAKAYIVSKIRNIKLLSDIDTFLNEIRTKTFILLHIFYNLLHRSSTKSAHSKQVLQTIITKRYDYVQMKKLISLACRKSNLKAFWKLYYAINESGLDSSECHDKLATTIHLIIESDSLTVFKSFYHKILSRKNIESYDLVHRACANASILKYLIAKGVNLDSEDSNGYLPIHYACALGYEPGVRVLIKHDVRFVKEKDSHATEPLSIAVANSQKEIVKYLMLRGAKINDHSSSGFTPLHETVYQNNLRMVKFLIKQGASYMIKDSNGTTALDLASMLDNTEIVSYLLGLVTGNPFYYMLIANQNIRLQNNGVIKPIKDGLPSFEFNDTGEKSAVYGNFKNYLKEKWIK